MKLVWNTVLAQKTGYKMLSKKGFSPELDQILREVEDGFAGKKDIENMAVKTVGLVKSAPVKKELKDGEERAYDDGSNVYLYRRVGGRLFKIQMTEV